MDAAIRAIPAELFRPVPAIYWTDLLASSVIGWTAFATAVGTSGLLRAVALLVAVFALYRAVLFIHEVTHLSDRDVPGFRVVWNVLVGVPLLIPSFLYQGVHTDHHRQHTYGTDADPEYLPFGRRSPFLILGFVLASLVAPVAFAARFAVLVPLSSVVPAVRRYTVERWSALVINHRYIRRTPIGMSGHVQEAAAFAVVWISTWLWWIGRLPAAAFGCWFVAVAAAFGINAVRTLAAHRYDHDSGELSTMEQLLDSCTIAPAGRLSNIGRALVAPVGLRYHSLHHWIPSLPYHSLGRAHRLLAATHASLTPYRTTLDVGFTPLLQDLVHRARIQSHRA